MGKVLCFGELLLRLSPDSSGNWLINKSLPVYPAGSEANVATALALWNVPVKYITVLPENFVGAQLQMFLQQKHIDTSEILFTGNRLGVYYLAEGLDIKNAGVIYDREQSSFSKLKAGMIDWQKAFEDVSWFHFSAICPALNENVAELCLEALQIASSKKITISIDLNYRAKLWQYGKAPFEVMPELAKYCNVIFGNIWAAEKMLNISANVAENSNDFSFKMQARKTSEEIMKQYPKCKSVINTFRFNKENNLCYYATLFYKNELFVSNVYQGNNTLDNVGTGDCCMAGIIKGMYEKWEPKRIVDFAAAAAFKQAFIKGDFTTSSIEEVNSIIEQYEQRADI